MRMKLFDSHCHLEDNAFDSDRDEVLKRAIGSGIVGIVTSPIYPRDSTKALNLFRKSSIVKISIGLDVAEYGDDEKVNITLDLTRKHSEEIVAVGEVGLDYRVARRGPSKEKQKEVFRKFIGLAKELDKPLVVHSLWAQRPVLRILDKEGVERVILHAFGGKSEDVEFAVNRGWMVSIPTNVVRSNNVQKVALATPLDHIVLESDSPVLAPDPNQRNEPANIKISARFIADMKGYDAEELAKVVTYNAIKVYGL